jgi:hypothetical protein
MDFPFSMPPRFLCPHCGANYDFPDQLDLKLFTGGLKFDCEKCGKPLDLWGLCVEALAGRSGIPPGPSGFSSWALFTVGCWTSHSQITLKAGQASGLDLGAIGVPIGARIIDVHYTPMQPSTGTTLLPIEVHSHQAPRHHEPRHRDLWPRPMGPPPFGDTSINVMATWIPRNTADAAADLLVEAFEVFWSGRLNLCVVPANAAVEATLAGLLEGIFRKAHVNKDGRGWLQRGTYHTQLTAILPVLRHYVPGVPLMPSQVEKALRDLNSARNDLGHGARRRLDKAEVARWLCGAAFGLHYLRAIRAPLVATPAAPAPQ